MMRRLLAVLLLSLLCTPSIAAQCGGDFQAFLAQISREAQGQGVSGAVVSQAFAGVSIDPNVLSFDRRQRGTFRKTFEEYAATRVTQGRISRGRQLLQRHAALLSRVEQQFGPPKEMIVAIWGLESDYGSGDMGKLPVVRTIATLAHDCRRTELFQKELIAALKILQRGDLTLQGMVGAYAGELGQTQFLPSSYIKYGVDYDGNGHVDLRRSVPDVLASTANYLKGYGWQAGKRWNEGDPNFEAIRGWNKAMVYAKTIAAFAERLEGGGARAEEPRR
jgi:lytic murein transglycosylase